MLRFLLFSAKLKYQQSTHEQCDLFLSRVDLLETLVQANASYIPSMQQLTQIDVLRLVEKNPMYNYIL